MPETENHSDEETAALPPDPGAEQAVSKLKYFIDNLSPILNQRFGTGFIYKNPGLAIEVLSLMVKLNLPPTTANQTEHKPKHVKKRRS